jgi:hypothetical protein
LAPDGQVLQVLEALVQFIGVTMASHAFLAFSYSTLTKPVPDGSAGLAGVAFPNGHS